MQTVCTTMTIGALLAVVTPTLASDTITVTSATRSIEVFFEEDDQGEIIGDQQSESITEIFVPFDRSFAVNGVPTARADLESSIVQRPNGFAILSDANTSATATSRQSLSTIGQATIVTSVLFEVVDGAAFSLEGFVSGESAIAGGFDSTGFNAFDIDLIGPNGAVIDESFDVFDLNDLFGDGTYFGGPIPITLDAALEPGSYELTLALEVRSTSSGSTFGGQTTASLGHDLEISITPAPSALALFTIAPLAIRRRR